MRQFASLAIVLALSIAASAQSINDAIKKVEATFEPQDARPGQTVTVKITVQLLDGYHTYPVYQLADEAKLSANKITFPTDGTILFVGETVDPVSPRTKKIKEGTETYDLQYYPGGGTWIRKAVVLPSAKAGAATSKIKVRLLVCDADNCFPPKTIDIEAALKVLEGPAVEVEKKYKDAVEKAGKK